MNRKGSREVVPGEGPQPARLEDVVDPRVASGPEQRAEEVSTRPHPWAGS